MTIAIMKTKAEQALTEQFETSVANLPGNTVVRALREAAIGRFAALGLPHRRIEEWKYTDLRATLKEAFAPARPRATRLDQLALDAALGPALAQLDAVRLVFVDGAFVPALSRLDGQHGAAYHFDPLTCGLDQGFDWLTVLLGETGGPKGAAVIALNTAYMTDGAMLRVADGARLEKPIHLVFVSGGAEKAGTATRNFLEIGEGSDALILETHVSLGAAASQTNTVTEIAVRDRARVQHIKHIASEGHAAGAPASAHIGTWIVKLGAACAYRAFQFTAGAPLVRNQLFVTFEGAGANLDISGAFLGRGSEHIDTTLVVDHAVPRCTSRELFKGVLDDRARGIFQGKIIVRPGAQKTDGKQMAQALMLSPDAEFDSKPELEIYADDVVCGHGSTAAELDGDLLFYCRARGIPLAEARALLTESFVGEAIEKVEHRGVRGALMGAAREWLAGSTAP